MKRFLIIILTLILPFLIIIPCVNYFVDPVHLYSSTYIDKIIYGLLQGKNVTNIIDCNERSFSRKFTQAHKNDNFDFLIIGASRVMTISEDAFIEGHILNLGMSGSKLEDLIAVYELCKENNIHYKNIIIGMEATYFNDFDTDTRWKVLEKEYKLFTGEKYQENNFTLIQNLFSISYFKSSLSNLANHKKNIPELEYVDTFINENGTKRIDGSIYYALEYRERNQSIIDNEAKTWTHSSFNNYNTLSKERKTIFEKFIQSLKKDGVNIIFFECPYNPLSYQRLMSSKGMEQGCKYIGHFANKNGIKIIGAYNPEVLQFKTTDFYDAVHARKESLDTLFLHSISH